MYINALLATRKYTCRFGILFHKIENICWNATQFITKMSTVPQNCGISTIEIERMKTGVQSNLHMSSGFIHIQCIFLFLCSFSLHFATFRCSPFPTRRNSTDVKCHRQHINWIRSFIQNPIVWACRLPMVFVIDENIQCCCWSMCYISSDESFAYRYTTYIVHYRYNLWPSQNIYTNLSRTCVCVLYCVSTILHLYNEYFRLSWSTLFYIILIVFSILHSYVCGCLVSAACELVGFDSIIFSIFTASWHIVC